MDIILSNSSGKPIYEQIAEQIKEQIMAGELAAGDALPSMRLLAKELRISVIMTLASLSFLGLGAQSPTPEWGLMINVGRTYFQTAWWISIFPGLAIFLTVLVFNLLGDGLREVLDPKTRKL